MGEQVPSTQLAATEFIGSEMTRQVWVVSDLKVMPGFSPLDFVYEEEFKGKKISLPPNGEKKVKMAWLHATKFLSQVSGFHQPNPNGGYLDKNVNVDKSLFGKPLRIIELTPAERLSVEGLTQEQISERIKADEEAAKLIKHDNGSGIPLGDTKPMAAMKVKSGRYGRREEEQSVKELDATL